MAAYTAQDVKNLREATAAGMLDCKKALDEAEGDYNKAIDIIRVKGLKGVTKREGRLTSNGAVVAKVEGNLGVMLELNCETDFVAKGERFLTLADELLAHLQNAQSDSLEAFLTTTMASGKTVQATVDEANATLGEKIEVRRIAVLKDSPVGIYLHRTSPDLPPQVGVLVQLTKDAAEVGKDIAQHIAAFAPQFVNREDVPAELIENERRIAEETAREEGKPEASLIKIVEGRVTGFVKEVSLIEQSFAKDAKKTVKQILDEAGTAVKAFNRFRVGQ
jgi:elongation factor Ts|uniref:translation elongation factor Ts n=1 Tax=Candidatus Planktophila sp. TaxID=2175601 RepID=UPI0040495CFD